MRRADGRAGADRNCQWVNWHEALHHFATYPGATQSQQHIKPLHWSIACRLVLEGGFHPDEVTPHPPFSVSARGTQRLLAFDPTVATGTEQTVLGGLKTKNVDVVVTKPGIGPVLAVSCKGMTGAFRNLTNRMEETIGECTNLHITYPALVFGYMFVLRANRPPSAGVSGIGSPAGLQANDIAVDANGLAVDSIVRFHAALRELTGRRGIRNDVSRYEAIALTLVESNAPIAGQLFQSFPPFDSPLSADHFFRSLYQRYEERYLLGAPDLKPVTQRLEWSPNSPALKSGNRQIPLLGYDPRLLA